MSKPSNGKPLPSIIYVNELHATFFPKHFTYYAKTGSLDETFENMARNCIFNDIISLQFCDFSPQQSSGVSPSELT